MIPEPIAVTLEVIEVLESLDIPYVIGGSLASARYGTARATMDSDLVVKLGQRHIPQLIARLKNRFYADETMALSAVQRSSSFNLIHLETMFKVDLFVASQRPFDEAQLSRRIAQPVAEGDSRTIFMLSAEDTILAKLAWYRMGGEQSERQWRDVQGVIKAQQNRLDHTYMMKMSQSLRVQDLLTRLLTETDQI